MHTGASPSVVCSAGGRGTLQEKPGGPAQQQRFNERAPEDQHKGIYPELLREEADQRIGSRENPGVTDEEKGVELSE